MVEILPGIRIDGLGVAPVILRVTDRVADQPPAEAVTFGAGRPHEYRLGRRDLLDTGERLPALVRVQPDPSQVHREHPARHLNVHGLEASAPSS
jgi:hypothetical protein